VVYYSVHLFIKRLFFFFNPFFALFRRQRIVDNLQQVFYGRLLFVLARRRIRENTRLYRQRRYIRLGI